MTEEETKKEGEETENTPTYLDQVKAERVAMEKIRDDTAKTLAEVKELTAQNIMSGGTTSGQPIKEEPKEESNKDYRIRINKQLAEGKYDRSG